MAPDGKQGPCEFLVDNLVVLPLGLCLVWLNFLSPVLGPPVAVLAGLLSVTAQWVDAKIRTLESRKSEEETSGDTP